MSIKPSVGETSGLTWTKSSHSTNDGPECVEVAWRKSSYSGSDNNDCVEVATTHNVVLVRDSKDITRPHFGVAPGAWRDFVSYVSAG